jgi:hypothetical protein
MSLSELGRRIIADRRAVGAQQGIGLCGEFLAWNQEARDAQANRRAG